MEEEVLIDDEPLNIGDTADDWYERAAEWDIVIYAANGVAISLPSDYKSCCYHIETTKYAAWWSLRDDKEFCIFSKNKNIWHELLRVRIDGSLELFCQADFGQRKIIYVDEVTVDKFIERYLNLKAFI
jgi:hypothetical protein